MAFRLDVGAVRAATEAFWGADWNNPKSGLNGFRAQRRAIEHMAKAIMAYEVAKAKPDTQAEATNAKDYRTGRSRFGFAKAILTSRPIGLVWNISKSAHAPGNVHGAVKR